MSLLFGIGVGASGAFAAARVDDGIACIAARLVGVGSVVGRSRAYENPAWGGITRAPFVNAAVVVAVPWTASTLLDELFVIERAFGRVRGQKNAARTLDLDVLWSSSSSSSSSASSSSAAEEAVRRFLIGVTSVDLVEKRPDALGFVFGAGGDRYAFTSPRGSCVVDDLSDTGWFDALLLRGTLARWQVSDASGQPMLLLERSFSKLEARVDVFVQDGVRHRRPIGRVQGNSDANMKAFDLLDENGQTFGIVGVTLLNRNWPVTDVTGKPLGHIKKVWMGLGLEIFSHTNDFRIELAAGLSIDHKAVVLAAALWIARNSDRS